ncbi:hypothetical protein CAJAP_07017 [Camponotus japonicus]
MPAGKQMVAPFIGLFVASAMTFCPAMKQAGDSPCVGKHHTTRLIRGIRMLFILKHSRTTYSHSAMMAGNITLHLQIGFIIRQTSAYFTSDVLLLRLFYI